MNTYTVVGAVLLGLMMAPLVAATGSANINIDDSCTGHREAPAGAEAFCVGIHRNDDGVIDCIGLYFEDSAFCFGVPGGVK